MTTRLKIHSRVGLYALIAVAFLVPLFADASVVLRSGEKVSLDNEQVVSGDFYAAGGIVAVSGIVEGDLYTAGGSITINGDVQDDVVAVGGDVQLHGAVGDDVRVVGGEVVIAEAVAGDVVVVGGVLNLLSTAMIDGDVYVLAGDVKLSGDISGNVTGEVESLRINGVVDGNVDVTVRSLTLGEKAYIGGNVSYRSQDELVRATGSVVVGDITEQSLTNTFAQASTVSIVPLLILLFTTLVYLLLFKEWMGQLMGHFSRSVGIHGIVGFAFFFAAPVVIILLLVSVLGIPLGLALLFGYMLLLVVSWSLSGIFLGALLSKLIRKEISTNVLWSIIGVLVVQVLSFIPVIGPLLVFALVLIIMGGLLAVVYRKLH